MIQIKVEGMHCTACAFTVEAALRQVPGVSEAQVDAASRRARVGWSPSQTRPSQCFQASAKAGDRLLPASDHCVRKLRQRESRLALWRWLVSGFCMMQVMMYASAATWTPIPRSRCAGLPGC